MHELEVFPSVGDGQGLSAAAKRLEVTPAAVSLRHPRLRVTLKLDDGETDIVGEGFHLALLPDFIIEDGHLLRVLERRERSPLGLSLRYPSRQHLPAKTRAFIDFVVEGLVEPVQKA